MSVVSVWSAWCGRGMIEGDNMRERCVGRMPKSPSFEAVRALISNALIKEDI
jgi:hypothetical protein